MQITLDNSLLFTTSIGKSGLTPELLQEHNYIAAFDNVASKLSKEEYAFISILSNTELAESCIKLLKKYHWAKQLVVLGIGGSDLGGRMLQQALQGGKAPMEVIFAGDTTDPEEFYHVTRKIDLKTTIVNVISKSGTTTETAVAYLYFKELFTKEFGDEWVKHFIFTTDSKEGILRKEANELGIDTLPVPDNVGGRFSVLSAVGLFPALAMGIDIQALLAGALQMASELINAPASANMAWQIALSHFLFQKEKGIDTVVLMPYIWRLELFANWFRQLWAESLGKDGKGILPIKAVGPADQHSQVQFYNQGSWLSTFLFIAANRYSHNVGLHSTDSSELSYLNNTTLEEVIKAECDATRFSLANNGRPSAYLEIEELDAKHLGALIILFEVAVVFLAQLLEVNAFDQPGVEEGKQFMYGLLGKSGFETKANEIKSMKQRQTGQKISYSA